MRDIDLTYTERPGLREGSTVLKLAGPLVLGNMFPLQNHLRTLTPKFLVFDLSETPYMDSAALGLLMNYYVSATTHGRGIALVGINERIRASLEMTKVDKVLAVFPTLEAAEGNS